MVRKLAVSLVWLVSILLFSSVIRAQENSCLGCHIELDDELKAPAEAWERDVHKRFGLSCSDCHGGNPKEEDIDLAKDNTFKGVPSRQENPEFCGPCHSDSSYMRQFNPRIRIDQMELYKTSQHGQLLESGDTKAAVCSDCHGIHGILEATQPKSMVFPWNIPETCSTCHSDRGYMSKYNLPTDQWEEYKKSVHYIALYDKKDLSAPVCNDCHGNHGANPPEITSIAYVCRQCHPSTGELFSASPHEEAYEALEISECEACHGNHKILRPTDDMLGTGEDAVCIQCHDPDTEPYKIASTFKGHLDTFVERLNHIKELLESAEKKGIEVSEAKFRLTDASSTLVLVRNLTHSLNLYDFEVKINEGKKVLTEVQRLGEEALREAKFRRTGLVIATVFILLLAIALFFKIRQIEKAPSK